MERVFVYGTLKRGRANEPRLPPHRFVSTATTVDPYPLVIAHDWFVPVLIDEPGSGLPIEGEVLEVDTAQLQYLDAFEGVGTAWGYRRVDIEVRTESATSHAWAYVKDRALLDQIHSEPMSSYPDDPRYVPPDHR